MIKFYFAGRNIHMQTAKWTGFYTSLANVIFYKEMELSLKMHL